MIFDISDYEFRRIFADKSLYLPIRWNGNNFLKSLEELYHKYQRVLKDTNVSFNVSSNSYQLNCSIKEVCDLILESLKQYLNGFPADAYDIFSELMSYLIKTPLWIYQKSCLGPEANMPDNLNLFRAAKVDANTVYDRKRIFHTPYNLRSKVSTNRYSIAGYPSLYLGTSLALCCKEIQYDIHNGYAIASKFKLERNIERNETNIRVIELALKPQDFFEERSNGDYVGRKFDWHELNNDTVRSRYLLWYPLIAACSFIRANKKDPFAAEYIIPQLLMQWVRKQMECSNKSHENWYQLIGLRYFSCASIKASDMGFNYVFPVSGKCISSSMQYCPILSHAFMLTVPRHIEDDWTVDECEKALLRDNNLDYLK